MEWYIVYAKFENNKEFHAFSIKEGRCVGRLVYATLMENTTATRKWLQELADLNRECQFVFQLRRNGKVCFQTRWERSSRGNTLPLTLSWGCMQAQLTGQCYLSQKQVAAPFGRSHKWSLMLPFWSHSLLMSLASILWWEPLGLCGACHLLSKRGLNTFQNIQALLPWTFCRRQIRCQSNSSYDHLLNGHGLLS